MAVALWDYRFPHLYLHGKKAQRIDIVSREHQGKKSI